MLLNCGVGEDSESSLDSKEIQLVYPKGNKSWIFIGRTDAEAETPIFLPPDVKYWLIGKDPDAGQDWRWEEKGMTEDEMLGWYHWLDGHEFEQAPGDGDGQGSLACCGPWGCKELNTAELSDWSLWANFYFATNCFKTQLLKTFDNSHDLVSYFGSCSHSAEDESSIMSLLTSLGTFWNGRDS